MNHEWIYKQEKMQTHAYKHSDRTIYAYRKFANVLGFGHLLKIREHSQLALKDLKSVETFPMLSCAIVFLVRTAHVHMVSFRSMGSVDFLCDSSGSKPSSCSICLRFCKGLNVRPDGSQRQKQTKLLLVT